MTCLSSARSPCLWPWSLTGQPGLYLAQYRQCVVSMQQQRPRHRPATLMCAPGPGSAHGHGKCPVVFYLRPWLVPVKEPPSQLIGSRGGMASGGTAVETGVVYPGQKPAPKQKIAQVPHFELPVISQWAQFAQGAFTPGCAAKRSTHPVTARRCIRAPVKCGHMPHGNAARPCTPRHMCI